MTNPLDYANKSNLLPKDYKFKISPSKFSTFVDKPFNWYRTEVLKEDGFTGNTSSVIGTICHYIAEMIANGKDVDDEVIEEYINSKEPDEDYDPDVVRHQYIEMAEILVNYYVLGNMKSYLETEQFHYTEVSDGFYAAGTPDFLQGSKEDCLIGDYKTYNSKTKPKAIPAYYKYQLLVLAYILRAKGYTVTRIRLVYVNRNIDGGISEKTGKALKSYPPEVTELTEVITEDDFDFIEGMLKLCIDSVKTTEKYPELTHVVWHDPRLKV